MFRNIDPKHALWACAGIAVLAVIFVGLPGSAPSAPPGKNVPGSAIPDVSFYRLLGALLVLAGLLYAFYRYALRHGRKASLPFPADRLHVAERYALGDRCSLLSVSWRWKKYLVGKSPAGLVLLDSEFPEGEGASAPPVPGGAGKGDFPSSLNNALGKGGQE